ncbi:MAG: response regulator [Cyanobacteria bacterium P01_A01_bin.45]
MKNILIAEDEARLAAFITKGLGKKGFSTTVASDGQEVIGMALKEEFELLLLDLGLPDIDGLTVLKELRYQKKNLPVIIVTAISDERTRIDALNSGANDYLTKPFSFKDLLMRIELHLGSKCSI